jgi:hypothetical protein
MENFEDDFTRKVDATYETVAPKLGARTVGKPEKIEKLRLTFFDELAAPTPKPWLIKNVIARGETSSWIAPPGRGKSALLTDICVHLAMGQDWRGFRTKTECGVVYFALERADLVKRRLIAHRLRDGLPKLPIAVAGQIINLMHESCVNAILDALKRAEERFGCEVGLGVFDTYSKGIAAGGGDESQARDQNIAIANLRRVIDRIGIHIATIGHTGKDEAKGERGSNARLADVDVQVQILGDTVKNATVKKANDQPEGHLTGFQLEPYEFGTDEDGDPSRTFILSREVIEGESTTGRVLSTKQKLALDALTEAILSHGRPAPAEYGLPAGIKVIAAEAWKTELHRQRVIEPDATNPSARYSELRNGLKARGEIGVRDDFVWRAA